MTSGTAQNDSAGRRSGGNSLLKMVSEAPRTEAVQPFSANVWIKITILAGLFAAINYRQFRPLVNSWMHDPNWSHGFLVPLFSLYLLYTRREELFAATRRTSLLGLVVMILGILAKLIAVYPIGNTWLTQLSMTVILFGIVLYLGGWGIIKLAWVPIFYLALAMPIPPIIYTQIATPLQTLAAKASTIILGIFGVGINVTASHLTITSISGYEHGLTVAEACSGVRSLIAYVALAIAWAYLEERPVWQRLVLVGSAVPIAVLCNVIRVTVTCTMFVVDQPALGQDFMHSFMGLVMMAPALLMLWLLGWMLGSLFIEVEDDEPETPEKTSLPQEATEA